MSGALLAEWSRLLVASLVGAGLRRAVICPGSRSTPFAWALAADERITVHSLIDERVAGFFALGLARASGEPALVLSTSGTAATSFFPAVVEASLSNVPLLVLTADRPLELEHTGAAQTIDQVKLYGDHVRAFFDLGAPDASPGALRGLARAAAQALSEARSPKPGPVHLNARARKPLEPAAPETPEEHETSAFVDSLVASGVTQVAPARTEPDRESVRALAGALARAERGVLVVGPIARSDERLSRAVSALAERLSFPVFAEATSGLRFGAPVIASAVDALDWLLRSPPFLDGLAPDLVLRLGGTPTSSSLERLFSAPTPPDLHVALEHGYSDPSNAARSLVQGDPGRVTELLVEALGTGDPKPAQHRYAEHVALANRAAWETVERVLERATATPGTSEPRAVRAAVEAIPDGGVLVLGNSLPVRETDAYVPAAARRISVVSQRGTNGIDGLVSGAAGTAVAVGRPTLLLVGDVSFVHDLGGLAAARLAKAPLAIVVIDNDGGRIFEELPVARLFGSHPKRAELWLTPPGLSLSHAAGLFGLPYVAPQSIPELRTAAESALERAGATIVHVRVLPHSARDTARDVRNGLDAPLADLAQTFRNQEPAS